MSQYTHSSPIGHFSMQVSPALRSIVGHFPPMEFAMAYGSGVFSQKGYSATQVRIPPPDMHSTHCGATYADEHIAQRPMIDFIFGVRDPKEWHAENLKINREHYALLGTRFTSTVLGTVISSVR